MDFTLSEKAAMGRDSGLGVMKKYGRHFAPAVTYEPMWDQGGAYTLFAAAVILGLSSSAAADDVAGTGAQTVRVFGQDINGVPQFEDVELDGLTKVETTKEFYRTFRLRVLTFGSGGANAGDIYAYDTSDTVTAGVPQTAAKIQAKITTGFGSTNMAIFPVPAGFFALLKRDWASMTAAAQRYAEIQLWTMEYGSGGFCNRWTKGLTPGANAYNDSYEVPERLEARTDIVLRVEADSGATPISGGFDLVLIRE